MRRADKTPGWFRATDIEPLKPSELFPEIARSNIESAIAKCDQIKREANVRARAVSGAWHAVTSPKVRISHSSRRSDAVVGAIRKTSVHADLNGVTRRTYTTQLSRSRRAQLYAKGLTSRGTPRVVPENIAFRRAE